MRSRWKTQFADIPGASKFHNQVREIIRTTPLLKNMRCFQEVPVCDLALGYRYTNHHVDWYIQDLNIVIELHGAQHYSMVNFGNKGYDTAMEDFRQLQKRDSLKKAALIEAGFLFLEIPYTMQKALDSDKLKELILATGDYDE